MAAPKLIRLNAHDPIAQARRAEAQKRQAAVLKAWKPSDKPDWLDEKTYRENILPRLAGITVRLIASALGVSVPYVSSVRFGKQLPHPRHWLTLARLAGVSQDVQRSSAPKKNPFYTAEYDS